MSIPAKYLVAVTPRTITAGVSGLETNGMVLTKSERIPADQPALIFTSASTVSDYFGPEADETMFAQQYFTGLTNSQRAPKRLIFGRRVDAEAAAWIRGGATGAKLADLKAVKNGDFTIKINGSEKTVSSVDLSSATSLSDVATKVATAITGVTGAYDSNSGTFTFTTETKGESASVEYAAAPSAGTDLATMLGLTKASGAILSQGAAARTIAADLDTIIAVTANWSQFTTLWEVTEAEEADAFAAWADIDDDYVYVFWSSDKNMTDQLTQADTIAAGLVDKYNVVMSVYAEDFSTAAFCVAYPATIKWDQYQGMKVIFGKAASGLETTVVTESVAAALDAIRVSYVGSFATRNDQFTFANRGALSADTYGFYDVLIGSIWLRSNLQTSIMNGFASVNRVPYNERGYTIIRAWCQDPINAALNVGVIDAGITLSESQKAQILQETGDENAASDIQTKGFYLFVQDPGATARANRESPVMGLYYAYAGSVQRVELPVTSVL